MALERTFFVTRSPPSLRHFVPQRRTGLKGDDAGTGNTRLSQPRDAAEAGAKARIARAPGEIIAIPLRIFIEPKISFFFKMIMSVFI